MDNRFFTPYRERLPRPRTIKSSKLTVTPIDKMAPAFAALNGGMAIVLFGVLVNSFITKDFDHFVLRCVGMIINAIAVPLHFTFRMVPVEKTIVD